MHARLHVARRKNARSAGPSSIIGHPELNGTCHAPCDIPRDQRQTRDDEGTMSWNWLPGRTATLEATTTGRDRKRLRALIDQGTRGSVDESDEPAARRSTLRDEVVCPFPARLAGVNVECIHFEWP